MQAGEGEPAEGVASAIRSNDTSTTVSTLPAITNTNTNTNTDTNTITDTNINRDKMQIYNRCKKTSTSVSPPTGPQKFGKGQGAEETVRDERCQAESLAGRELEKGFGK